MILDHMTETISAIATPLGVGGVAIVRVSGSLASTIILSMSTIKELSPNTIRLARVHDAHGQMIDEALIAWFATPHSYTGEDIAEVQCHGGLVVARQILERTFQLGARLALSGEFTQRAFINGKIDLVKAESVIDLIEAKTEKASAIAAKHLEGDLSVAVETFRDELLALVSHLEVHLDYPDEETLSESTQYTSQLNHLLEGIDRLLVSFQTGRILHEGLSLVIVGRPNVGKSSLLNTLINEHRVLVSDQPGTTRDAVEVWMKIAEVPVRIVDTAGLHETSDAIEQMGMARTVDYFGKADLILFVVDGGAGITPEDQIVMKGLPVDKTLVIVNKIDMPLVECATPFSSTVRVSAKTKQGLDDLWALLEQQVLSRLAQTNNAQPVLTNERQKDQLLRAKTHILEAIQSLHDGLSEEFWLIGLRAALRDLGEILGQDVSEEVLSAIFSRFCVGK